MLHTLGMLLGCQLLGQVTARRLLVQLKRNVRAGSLMRWSGLQNAGAKFKL